MSLWDCLRTGKTLSRRNARKFNYRLMWIAVGIIATHLMVATCVYYSTLTTPPVRGIQKKQYEYVSDNSLKQECLSSDVVNENTDKSSECKTPSPDNNQTDKIFMDYVRDSRDLYAQEGMWRAANFLSVIGALQFIFGIPALVMIWLTLKATRDTLNETQGATEAANRAADAAESAERAHLLVDFEFDPISNSEGRHRLDIMVVNAGKTPAVNVQAGYDWSIPNTICIGGDLIPISILPGNDRVEVEAVSFGRGDGLPVTVDVTISSYEDIFGGKHAGVVGTATINEKMELVSRIELFSANQK